jgi:hypothetical protein
MRHGKRLTLVTLSLLSVMGASSVAAYGNTQKQVVFKASGVRSHGLPAFNLMTERSTASAATPAVASPSSAHVSPYVRNDDPAAEVNWAASENKVGEGSGKKVTGVQSTNPILYYGGMLYSGNVAIYPVWVGTWTHDRQELWNEILSNLITSLPSEGAITAPGQIFATNSLYFSLLKPQVAAPTLSWPAENLSKPIAVAGSGIIPVSDEDVAVYIDTAITTGLVPSPTSAAAQGLKPIYVYIGANNTLLSSGFGTLYCGWHSYGTYLTSDVPYIALQDFTSNFLHACAWPTNRITSPNGDPSADSMASVFAHEVSESLTDPYGDAWYDANGWENADKCAWNFGPVKTGANKAGTYKYNLTSGDSRYLIQRNWLANNIVKEVVNTPTGPVDNACSLTSLN